MDALLLTVPEAAKTLGIGRSTIYRLIDNGELAPVRIGRAVRIPYSVLAEYVAALREAS